MGMFDDVVCDYPLPEGAPRTGYQTKDTPAQMLDTYTITEDGRLVDDGGATLDDFHGDLEFYASNVSGCGPNGYITSDGKPYEGWNFVARFTNGRVTRLTGGREKPDEFFAKPPCSREEFWRERDTTLPVTP
jgi:hypothetical protein